MLFFLEHGAFICLHYIYYIHKFNNMTDAPEVLNPQQQPQQQQQQQDIAPVKNQLVQQNVPVANKQAVQGSNRGIALKVEQQKLPEFLGQKD